MKLLLPTICVALLVASGGSASPAHISDWRYDSATSERPAVATNLATGLTARCDAVSSELVIDFEMEPGLIGDPEMVIYPDKGAWPMTVTANGRQLQGRLKVTKAFAADIERTSLVQIYVPTEMDEPLHVGAAGPLRRIIADCAKA